MKNHRYVMLLWLLAAAMVLSLSGCGDKIFSSKPKTPAPYIHTVQWSGESLARIAEWYTGDSQHTASLMTANPDLGVGHLPLGTSITIPGNLLVTRDPMPENFLDKEQYSIQQKYDQPEDYFVHTVVHSGESISIIAAWYTGDLQNWKTLAAVNPHLNPNRIKPGDRINIPEEMMVTHQKMPLSHVHKYVPPAPKRKVVEPAPELVTEEEAKRPESSAEEVKEEVMDKVETEVIEEVPEKPEEALPIFGPK